MIRAEMKNKLHCVSHLSLAPSELTLVMFGTSYGALTSLVSPFLADLDKTETSKAIRAMQRTINMYTILYTMLHFYFGSSALRN